MRTHRNSGQLFRLARRTLDLDQEPVAAAVGVSRQALSNWEIGRASPTPEHLRALVRELPILGEMLRLRRRKRVLGVPAGPHAPRPEPS